MLANNTFERTYVVNNTASLSNDDQKQALEKSHNIYLPESAFNVLLANQCEFPLLFTVSNYEDNTQITHVGVQEFSSNDGIAIIPNTLMKRLSYPTTIRVKYTQLPPAQNIEFQPHNSSFLKQQNNQMYIRNTLSNLSCISIDDTINVIIDNKTYNLNITNVKPSIFNAVCLLNTQYSINLIDAIVNDKEFENINQINCPIESNVNKTKGNEDSNSDSNSDLLIDNNNTNAGTNDGTNDTLGGEDINDDTDAGFTDNSAGDWGDSDYIGSDYELDYDGQDEIPIKGKQYEFTPPPNNNDISFGPDPMSTADGNSCVIKPITTKIDYRAWICEHCRSINNLLDSIKRGYQCINCVGRYKPGQTIIESKEQDKPINEQQKYTVWICQCSAFNANIWTQCNICQTPKPKEGLVTVITHEKPIAMPKPEVVNFGGNNNNAGGGDAGSDKIDWTCQKCNWYNNVTNICTGCGRSKYGNDYDENENGNGNNYHIVKVNGGSIFRRKYPSYLMAIGTARTLNNYPIESTQKSVNHRLIDIFGMGYRNSLLLDKNNDTKLVKNEWINKKIVHGIMEFALNNESDFVLGDLCPRNAKSMALNEKNGNIACITKGEKFIIVFTPNGCNQFNILGYYSLDNEEIKNSKSTLSRIRFINNDIYIFDLQTHIIYNYQFNPINGNIQLKLEIFDEYFIEAGVTDFVVTDELLIVLFGRWLGVYKLKPKFEWFHAVAYSQNENTHANSIEMNVFDDWENIEINKQDLCEEEEEKKDFEEKIYPINIKSKPSIKNYIFINCENSIIAIHATNPTFDFLHIGNNTRNGTSYCNSKQYGTFWINNEMDRIIQSPVMYFGNTNIILSLEKDFKYENFQMIPMPINCNGNKYDIKNISKFNNIVYDEGYGISGRLLINCTIKYNKSELSLFYQLFNQNELLILKEYFLNNDYFLMPGTNFKPFNLIVYVFEMLYGTDLIDSLIQSPDFNSVYALPGNDNNKMENMEENNNQKEENINMNTLLKVKSKCLIYTNNRWCDGIVAKIFEINESDKEFLEIEYIENEMSKKEIFDRYNKYLKYNESIPLKDMKSIKIKWEIGDKCLHFDETSKRHFMAEIIKINDIKKQKMITLLYANGGNESTIKYNDNNLYKLDDVVKNNNEIGNDNMDDMDLEQDEGDNDKVGMMEIGAEGPLDQSYIAIKAIGKEKAEIDQDLVFVDDDNMEIEHEGVNEIENN